MFIKITKYLNQRNIHVIFISSAQITWSRSLRAWRGGFLQIRPEIMTNPHLEDFRHDFGLDDKSLGRNPMVMEILGESKLYMATHRYSLGQDGTITTDSPITPNNMNDQEQKFFTSVYKQADYMTDNLNLLVLQNDHREPVLESLVKTEGNTLLADLQNALGQVQPNWQSDRLRYTTEGEIMYKKDQMGRTLYDQPLKSDQGLPKTNLPIYHPQERTHMINVFSHMETEDERRTEIYARIMKPRNAGKRAKLWDKRKEQIKYHLKEEAEVQKQLEKEKLAFHSPLQTLRINNQYGGPRYQHLMPEAYKRWMGEQRRQHDCRGSESAEEFETKVKKVFQDLEDTMTQVRLPTIPGVKYHTGKKKEP